MTDLPLSFDRSTFFKMVLLVNLTARPFERLFETQHDIRLVEWRVVLALANHPNITATQLGDALGLDKMAVSRAVRRLELLNRITRETDQFDHRRIRLALTDEGWSLYNMIAPSAEAREAQVMAPLSPEDRRQLDLMLDQLLVHARGLSPATDGAEPGVEASADLEISG